MNAGIYAIENTINNKVYIGSSVDTGDRIRRHKQALRIGRHHNAHLQNAWDKYGEENFTFTPLEHCKRDRLLEREQNAMDIFGVVENGYNIRIKAESNLGLTRTPESKERMSIAQKKRMSSQDERRKLSEIGKGRITSPETRRKISVALQDKIASPESRKRMSKAQKGRIVSLEARKNISEAQKKRATSPEGRKFMSEIRKGKPHSPETRRKISEEHKGKRLKDKNSMWIPNLYRPPCPYCGGDHIRSVGRAWNCATCGRNFSKKRIG